VLAVDRNPRAVGIARFNARLNALDNVECREGDLFAPVEDCRFDLVVSNPPFVISPEANYIYRDSGRQGDEICRAIVREVPALLREGGYCQILCNWAHLAGQEWPARLAGWFAGSGCDAWVMRSETLDAPGYAALWIRHTERKEGPGLDDQFQRWLAYYQQQGIEAVSSGVICMRRRSGGRGNWFRADDAPPQMRGPAGESIVQGFQIRDLLETLPDPQSLLRRKFRVSPHVRLQQSLQPADSAWLLAQQQLQLTAGLPYAGELDPYMADLLVHCDGRSTLEELVREMAASMGQDLPRLTVHCAEILRRLIEQGFLLPVDEESHS